MLKRITIKSLNRFPDGRGFLTKIMRKKWKTIFGEDNTAQVTLSLKFPNAIRAQYIHMKGRKNYFTVSKGATRICVFNGKTGELNKIVSAGSNIQIVCVPGHYLHGFKAIGTEPAALLYFTAKLYDHMESDEERKPRNDQTIIPTSINGKQGDSRFHKPWN